MLSFILTFILLITVSMNGQTLKTSKKVFAKTDTVEFYYQYSGEWESTWLIVDPVKGKDGVVRGDHMTTAADLYGNPATRKFFNRFSPGKYKAVLVGNNNNGSIVKELARCEFEISAVKAPVIAGKQSKKGKRK